MNGSYKPPFSREVKASLSKDLQSHYESILAFLSKRQQSFTTIEACRIDNHHIIPFSSVQKFRNSPIESEIVAFVPAAGAASRYFLPFFSLLQSLGIDLSRPHNCRDLLLAKIAENRWLLPRQFLEKNSLDFLQKPKALQLIHESGLTFLKAKCLEHEVSAIVSGQVFVSPPSFQSEFEETLKFSKLKTRVFTQDQSMSTVRVYEDLSIAKDHANQIAYVPAGHGSLIQIFPKISGEFPQCESLFIRNVDNVCGISSEILEATSDFLKLHDFILQCVKKIRTALVTGDYEFARPFAEKLFTFTAQAHNLAPKKSKSVLELLQEIAMSLFYAKSTDDLKTVFARPVHTMGQVPNIGNDIGGTPVIAETPYGKIRICLELSHFSQSDREEFLQDKATHFNPVFLACELPSVEQKFEGHPFYTIVEKSYLGRKVYYYESLLYEMLGNSAFFNLVFVEIPRFLFNPHKSLDDHSFPSFE